MFDSRLVIEAKLEQVIGDLGATLAREDEHAVPGHSQGKVTAGRGYVPLLVNLDNT